MNRLFSFSDFNLIFITSIICLLFYVYYSLTFWKRQNIPNILSHSVKAFRNHFHLEDQKCIQKYGRVVGTYELLKPVLLLAEPELVNKVLVSNFRDFSDHRVWVSPDHPFGKSLILLPYEEWKISRHIISHSFSTTNLKRISYILEESADSLINKIDSNYNRDDSINISKNFDSFSLEVLLKAFFGIDIWVEICNDTSKQVIMEKITKILITDFTLIEIISFLCPKLSWLLINRLSVKNCEFFIKLVESIIDERKNGKTSTNDVLQYLLNAEYDENIEKSMSIKDIISNCFMFLLVGSDTTSGTLSHSIHVLAKNKAIQEKLCNDINQGSDPNETVFHNISKMSYLDAFLKEILRLYPTGTRIERKAVKDTKLNDIIIPKDSYIVIPIYAIQRDPNNFENPDEFITERFLHENIDKIKPGTYLPFASGPRNCVGMKFAEMNVKICIVKLLKKFQFVECNKAEELEYSSSFPTLKPNNVYVKIIKRIETHT